MLPFPPMAGELLEISDLVIDYDPVTLDRRPVKCADVVARLSRAGQRRGAQIAAALPTRHGVLEDVAIDALLLRAHTELQRLSEEFMQGARVRRLLGPLCAALRAVGVARPIRVVDVGCGLGYVIRWLAAHGELGDDVELIGCDYNAALIAGARAATAEEQLRCTFVVANAFTLADPATVFLSSGVLHHFRGDELVAFFRAQAQIEHVQALLHYDIHPSWLSGIGSWMFHTVRMREPLARHDGVVSARRAHGGDTLLAAARAGAPGLALTLFETPSDILPVTRTLRPIVGVRAAIRAPLEHALGALAHHLGPWR